MEKIREESSLSSYSLLILLSIFLGREERRTDREIDREIES